MEWEKRQKFSIRKFTIGAASVMIGQFYLGTVTNAPSVSADERSRADVEVVTLPQDEQLNHVILPAEKTAEQAPAAKPAAEAAAPAKHEGPALADTGDSVWLVAALAASGLGAGSFWFVKSRKS